MNQSSMGVSQPPTLGSPRPAPRGAPPSYEGATLQVAPATTETAAKTRLFMMGLFDLSFRSFFTTRAVSGLWALYLLALVLILAGGIFVGVSNLNRGQPIDPGGAFPIIPGTPFLVSLGIGMILGTPVFCVFALVWGRIFFESLIVFFRIAEHLSSLDAKTRG